jgi:cell division protein FtsB
MFLLLLSLFGPSGLRDLRELSQVKEEITRKIVLLEQENRSLEEEIASLQGSLPDLERLIRLRLGWIREGEKVFLFPQDLSTP